MDKELRILILEDVPADAELEERELRKAGLVFTSKVVDTREAFLKELDDFSPDVILSDYDLPAFDGLAALRIAKGKCPDVPFILVTGKLGEEFAIENLKEGATDYVLKSNLKRLVPSVKRALKEAKLITERKRIEHQVRERIKELNAFYGLAEITEREGISLDKLYQELANILPKSWQYPDIACSRIVIGDSEFRTENFKESAWKQSAPVKVHGSAVGKIDVGYLEKRPEEDEGPFLKEERLLIDAIAERIGHITERKRAEAALRESEDKFRGLYESSRDALMTLEPPSWAFTSGNPATVAMFRAKNEEDFISHAPWQLSPERQPDGRASDEKAREMIETAMREGSHFFEWTHKRIDGEKFPATILLTRMELAGRRFLQATVRDITVFRQAEKLVERLNQQNELILKAAGEGIFGLDIQGKHTFINPSAAQMLGYTVDELIGRGSHATCHYKRADGSPYSEEECPIYTAYKDGKVHHVTDEVFWRKDGTSYPVEYTSTPIIEDGKISGAVVTFMDITKRRQAEKALLDSEAYLKTIMAAIQAGVIVIDVEKHTIADINEAAENLIGDKREAIIGKECHKYICPAEKGKCPITDLNQIVDRSERVLINAKGEKIPILKTVVPLTIKGRKYLIESFIDITERKRMEDELQRLAITDNLTQAYNRTKYEEVIKREIERTKRSSTPLSIAMFDIDHFKKVNDAYGHDVGDYVLKTLSQIVKKKIRDIDYLIRWGGEEFIVIALDTDLRGTEMMAEKIRHAIGNYSFDKVGRVTVSFGVTQFKQEETEDSFIKRADDALYQAKEKGRNRVEVRV